jgi:thymidylate kinase
MTSEAQTTLQREAPELIEIFADELRVLNDRGLNGLPGGGDVDCAARGIRPNWPLRLREWRLCQSFWYDVTATYNVFVRGEETLSLDVVDDARGIGKYRFSTDAFVPSGSSGSLAPSPDRAAYLTLKRIVKRMSGADSWTEVKLLANADRDAYKRRLERTIGHRFANEIVAALDGQRVPDAAMVDRWHRRLRHRAPKQELLRLRRQANRFLHRVAHPTGFVVAVVGPDGSGKSTLAQELAPALGPLFRRSLRIHFRPGILPRPGSVVGAEAPDGTAPHARRPHGRFTSLVLLAYYWVDFQLGYLLTVFPLRLRGGLVVVERGFLDIAVDPLRYRLSVPPTLVHAMSRLLASPDITIVLEGNANEIAQRKSELPVEEIIRQSERWRSLAGRTRSVRVDTSSGPDTVLAEVRSNVVDRLDDRTLALVCGGWAPFPSARRHRLYLPQQHTKAALGGLRLEAPSKTSSRIGLGVARALVASGALRAFPAVSPPELVRSALAPHLPAGGTIAVKRSIHPNRFVAAILDVSGAPVALAKIATDEQGRNRLRTEAAAIVERAALLSPPLRGPRILAADDDALVLDWIPYRMRRRPWLLPTEVSHGLGLLFAAGKEAGLDLPRGPAHGDAAPWNLLRVGDGWVLVDWELSSPSSPAFLDVLHYVIQSHLLLGRPRREELLRGIKGDGWIGEALAAYASGAGLPVELASEAFAAYDEYTSAVRTRRDMNTRSIRRWHALKAEVTQ